MSEIVVFDKVKAEIAEYKQKNAELVFDYEDPKGNKDARSHCAKLRKVKTQITGIHKDAKADILTAGRALDAKKNELTGEVEEMIAVHYDPIKRIEDAEEAKKQAFLDEQQAKRDKEEADRLADLEAKEKELADLKAKETERVAEVERAAREKKIAEDAKIEAEQKAQRELKAAEERRIADIAAAERKVRDETEAKERATAAVEAKRLAEEKEKYKAEAARVADKEHRKEVEQAIIDVLSAMISDDASSQDIVDAIVTGEIPNLTINY